MIRETDSELVNYTGKLRWNYISIAQDPHNLRDTTSTMNSNSENALLLQVQRINSQPNVDETVK